MPKICLREKLASLQIVKKLSVFHGTQIFITVLSIIQFLNPIVYQMNQSTFSYPKNKVNFDVMIVPTF